MTRFDIAENWHSLGLYWFAWQAYSDAFGECIRQ